MRRAKATIPSWLSDFDQGLIIGEDWREQQREILELPKYFIEPDTMVRHIFEEIEEYRDDPHYKLELGPEAAKRLTEHLAKDPVAWANYFTLYQRRDPPRVWQRGHLTPGQLVIVWNFVLRWAAGMPVRDVLLKARRQGFSLVVSSLMGWIHFFHENRGGIQAAHEKTVSQILLRYLRSMWERMPREIRPSKKYSSKSELLLEESKDEKRSEGDYGLMSFVLVTGIGSQFAGSGVDAQATHLDEVGKWDKLCDPDEQFDSITNTVPEAAETWIALTSTAHGAKTWFHGFWGEAMKIGQPGWNGFRPIFIPWFFDPRNSMTAPRHEDGTLALRWSSDDEDPEWGNEVALKRRWDLDDDQLYWRRIFITKQKARGGDLSSRISIFKQEYPSDPIEAWIYATGRYLRPSFIAELLERSKSLPDPVFTGRVWAMRERGVRLGEGQFMKKEHGGPFVMWRRPQQGKEYLISADVSSGEAVDASCIKVHRWEPMKLWLAAEWYGLVLPSELAHIMWRLGHFYNTAFLNWERTGAGMSIASHLVKGPANAPHTSYPLNRLFRRRDPNQAKYKMTSVFGLEVKGGNKRGFLDMWTDTAKADAIELTPADINEASELEVDDKGRIETHGCDRFMATVVQCQSRNQFQPGFPKEYSVKQEFRQGSVEEADYIMSQANRRQDGTREELL